MWRNKISPRKVLHLIENLPSHSAYQEAMAQDDELAAEFAGSDGAPADPRPKVTEWSPNEQILAGIYNRLGELISGLASVLGGRGGEPDRWLGPETALDRALRVKQDDEWASLVDDIERARSRTT